MIYLAITIISQPEENLVTCLAHLEYRGLHCIVLQLLDTNIRQVVIIIIVCRKALKKLFLSCVVSSLQQQILPNIVHMLMKIHKTRNNLSQVIYRNGRRGLSPWATNKFGRDLLVALNTLHKVAFLSFDQKQQ